MSRYDSITPDTRRQRGFYLLEVLVSLLVLAIGLLGIAALQAQGLRNNHDAYTRSQATMLAYDIIDRMRANRANVAQYAQDPGGIDAGLPCDPSLSNADLDTPEKKVQSELQCWYDAVANTMPGGLQPCIQVTGGDNAECDGAGADPNMYDITIYWVDRGAYDADGNQVVVSQTWTVWP